jgi:Ni/Fe-hydrogenase 1 B-type cytochrome subunit
VWELPVRFTHWLNVAAIAVLSFTGYYIGNPYIEVSQREFYASYFMGNMRLIHIITAYIFIASLIIRTYWAFWGGNQWASWRALVPFFTSEGRGYVLQSLKYYLFIQREPPTVLGHNALAGFTYGIIVLLYFIEVFTGFALYGLSDPGGIWWNLTSWVFHIFDPQNLRLIHHMIMWLLLAFVIHHVYSAFLVDAEEANGLMSSIFSGWKFIVPKHSKHGKHGKHEQHGTHEAQGAQGTEQPADTAAAAESSGSDKET